MKAALGRGLDALIPEKGLEVINIDIRKIIPNSGQPRKIFKDSALKELAQSIKEKGIIQPIVVSKNPDGNYSLIAGERRWRAASMAGLEKVPAIIKKVDGRDSLEIALIENIQREDLNPLEMAEAFEQLMSAYDLTQEELSDKVGKERATISNYLRLLKLPDDVKRLVNDEKISMGHARALLTLENRARQSEIARTVVKDNLSVRQVEELVRKKESPKSVGKAKKDKDLHVRDIEDKLKQNLGTKVSIVHKGKKGKIEIEFYSLEELDRLLEILIP